MKIEKPCIICGKIIRVRMSMACRYSTCSKECSSIHKETRISRIDINLKDILQRKAYRVWYGIKTRCENPNAYKYYRYGGRGIKLEISLLEFVRWYVSEFKKLGVTDAQVDRINNDGSYNIQNMRLIRQDENKRKAFEEVDIIRIVGMKNMIKANKERRFKIKIGLLTFDSLNEAGRYFGCKDYIRSRIKRYDSAMPDGTKIEVVKS